MKPVAPSLASLCLLALSACSGPETAVAPAAAAPAVPAQATAPASPLPAGPAHDGFDAAVSALDEAAILVIWEGTDTTTYPKNTIGWLQQQFEATPHLVAGARITLTTNRVWGWNEIDAVQIAGTAESSGAPRG
jgi:hypothetical protein